MANSVTTNPWIIDTPASSLVWVGDVHIVNIEFQDYTNDTDTCIVKNAAGDVIWSGNGASDLSVVRSGNLEFIHGGVAVTAITAGKVRIFHE